MTLGNMRANGVRSLDVSCWQCHHRAIMSADPWSDDVPVPTFGPRMVCTNCGIIGADVRPHWHEQPLREASQRRQWWQQGSPRGRSHGLLPCTSEPEPREAAASHFLFRSEKYGFHFIGTAVCGDPLFELTQPPAVYL